MGTVYDERIICHTICHSNRFQINLWRAVPSRKKMVDSLLRIRAIAGDSRRAENARSLPVRSERAVRGWLSVAQHKHLHM
jgi:hypothetical protein